jgi:hypothetical protein
MGNLSFGTGSASYYEWTKQGRVYCAYAKVTSPVIYTTAAGTGGPLLWNNSNVNGNAVNAVILAVGANLTTASSVAATLGITGNSDQTSAPSSTTAIDAQANLFVGGGKVSSACNTYRVGTVSTAGNFFIPTHTLDTGAVTAVAMVPAWVDLGGLIVVPPGSWVAVSASATATSAVANIGLIWAEIPLD